jgi:hypothetical protein
MNVESPGVDPGSDFDATASTTDDMILLRPSDWAMTGLRYIGAIRRAPSPEQLTASRELDAICASYDLDVA